MLVQRKVTKRNTPRVARLPGILPSRFASGLRGSLSAHPCARSALARILRATLRAFPPPARRATGAPFGRHPAAEAVARGFCSRAVSMDANDRNDTVQGCTDSCMNRRRSRRRASQPGREKPEGSRRWIAAIAKQYMDVLSEQPRLAEKRRAVRFARCESDRRVRCLAFLVTFWAMPKSNRLAAGETKLCTSRT